MLKHQRLEGIQASKSNVFHIISYAWVWQPNSEVEQCRVSGNQSSRGGKQRLMVNSTRTKKKANVASQILTCFCDDEHFTNGSRKAAMVKGRANVSKVIRAIWWLSHVKRGLKDDFVRLCGKGRLRKGNRANVSVQPPGKDFGIGRVNSSSPVSLPRHSSPLNKIDYWFLLSSPALLSIRLYFPSREQRKKKKHGRPHLHRTASHTVRKWSGGVCGGGGV